MLKDLAMLYECFPGENMSYLVVDRVFICKISLKCTKTKVKKLHKWKPVPGVILKYNSFK